MGGMTIKQLSVFCQRDEKTIRRWINKAANKNVTLADKMSSSGHGVSAEFNLDEVECILRASTMSKDAVSILIANAEESRAPTINSNILSSDVVQIITQIVSATVKATLDQIPGLTTKRAQSVAPALIAPKKDSRAHITELVRKYANAVRLPYQDVYSMLYTEYGYRTHSNPTQCAMNREMRIIDYIASINRLEELEAVAIDYLIPPKRFERVRAE